MARCRLSFITFYTNRSQFSPLSRRTERKLPKWYTPAIFALEFRLSPFKGIKQHLALINDEPRRLNTFITRKIEIPRQTKGLGRIYLPTSNYPEYHPPAYWYQANECTFIPRMARCRRSSLHPKATLPQPPNILLHYNATISRHLTPSSKSGEFCSGVGQRVPTALAYQLAGIPPRDSSVKSTNARLCPNVTMSVTLSMFTVEFRNLRHTLG
ncbi:hypothetical protein BGZ60DRAFT_527694 [Tricladium varicosporioides]|nr:hypothetical protein BGZ60DRAFT_527694 [Hymenoscyphus varicosporioides]